MVLFLLGVAGMKCLRHQARWFILTYHWAGALSWNPRGGGTELEFRCLAHFIPATPNRGTNMPFLSKRNTNLDYAKNA